jgi:tetratricopeptide (TPR) repeat protein
LGRYAPAADRHREALALYRQVGDRSGEAWALTGLGSVAACLGRLPQATEHYQQALTHAGLGHAHDSLGHPADARHHLQQALTLYTELGMPDAVRTDLAALD